jgi:hypothetical protein
MEFESTRYRFVGGNIVSNRVANAISIPKLSMLFLKASHIGHWDTVRHINLRTLTSKRAPTAIHGFCALNDRINQFF